MGRGLICGKSNVGRKVEAWAKKIKCPQSFSKIHTRERECWRQQERVSDSVCVCVCERERERERLRKSRPMNRKK